ncbi:MAG: hypothetical protein M0P31_19005 [Solirubrobacteraceae bacterium]|nr:hypothetical protein [Solirubrobacteraceae bacterium]
MSGGSFADVAAKLEAIARDVHPDLHASRWWHPNLALPCAYWWPAEGSVTTNPDGCMARDVLPLTFSIAQRPTLNAGDDLLSLEHISDLARARLDEAVANPLEQLAVRHAKRTRGWRLANDTFASVRALVVEFTVELTLRNPTP